MNLSLNKDTQLSISLSARPSNFGTRFQNYLYSELGLNFLYKAFAISDIAGAITGIRVLGIRGRAVSMPFKEECIRNLDELDLSAQNIGSVNTIVNNRGVLKGFNTDAIAVLRLLRDRGISPEARFALAGSRGMANAVAWALHQAGFRRLSQKGVQLFLNWSLTLAFQAG